MIFRGQKYHAQKVETPDGVFDSKREYRRWQELKLMQAAYVISDLKRQVPFVLIDEQEDAEGKTVERKCVYRADFTYRTAAGEYVVEDAKGFRTPDYIIKRKLMLQRYGIRVTEV